MSSTDIQDEKLKKKFLKIMSSNIDNSTIDDSVAQKVGEYLYYHTQIELSLDSLIQSILPELEMDVLKIDSYSKKLSLIKSLTPSASELGLFDLLEKLNSVRNSFAHESPDNIKFHKINKPLINLFKRSIRCEEKVYAKLEKIGKSGDITIPVKVIYMTKVYLDLLVKFEKLGKEEDKTLRSFEALRKFSSLFVRRRFSILMYQFQTSIESGDAPENFKQVKAFSEITDEIKTAFLDIFKSYFSK
jgi:hypothetical protein